MQAWVRIRLPLVAAVLSLLTVGTVRSQSNYATPYKFTTLAGLVGGAGSTDGTGSAALFNGAQGVAVDGSGNIYVADYGNSTIRKITPGGVVTTLAGTAGLSGATDATGSAARFNFPTGVAVDGSGNIYVADYGNSTIRKITAGGVVTTLAGTALSQGSTDGTGSAARFFSPISVAVDGSGHVYVADTYNDTIRKIIVATGAVTTLAGTAGSQGSTDGMGSAARFNLPSGVALDGSGNIFVVDSGSATIRKVTTGGLVTTLAGTAGSQGSADGTGGAARFNLPEGVAVDGSGNVYVADTGNNTIRKITAGGAVTTLAGSATNPSGATDGTGGAARFNGPAGVAVDGSGNVYVADQANSTIRKITSGGVVTTLAGNAYGSTDGTGSAARFYNPNGVAVDGASTVYVADFNNHTIRKITSGGVVTTLAGSAGVSGSTDGTGSAARFFNPTGVAVDGAGNVYVADQANAEIRKITPGGVVTTLAGSALSPGTADGTGSAAQFNIPFGVAVDGSGNVYVTDQGAATVRKITPGGVVTTLAGTAGSYGSTDGTGSAARFSIPQGVAVDGSGNLYVADQGNATIRKIASGGVVTTLAGTAGSQGSKDGTGSNAWFSGPSGVAVDGSGNVYVTDQNNHTIRKIVVATGVVTTLAGTVGSSGSADGTGSAARFFQPSGVAVDGAGTVYVGDTNNHTIRWGALAVPALTSATTASGTTGQSFTYTLTFSGALPANYTATGLPSGLSLNLTSGVIAGIPGVAGTFPVTVGATNGAGTTSTTLSLAIKAAATVTLGSLSQTYDGTPKSATATTNPPSLAVTFTYNGSGTAPTAVGSYAVVGTINSANYQGSSNGTLVIGPGTPTITFGPLASHTYGDAPFSVSATASFGLVPTYSIVSGPATIIGNTVTLTGAGTVTVRAALAATANTNAAQVDQSFTVAPPYIFTTLAGSALIQGTTDGTGSAARFYQPYGVAVDGVGTVYVADQANATIRKITAGGVVTTLAGTVGVNGLTDGTGSAARFSGPAGVAVDGSGNVYVADQNNNTIRKITPLGVVTTLAGTANGTGGSTDATGAAAQFNGPSGVALDGLGNVYVADELNHTIRKITAGGSVTTLAGTARVSGSMDSTGAAARFNNPAGVAVDGAGNVYVADASNHTIRKITAGGVVTTLAGMAGSFGSTDATGAAARFTYPNCVAVDGSGNVYVADSGNNTIRKIVVATGMVTTLAGMAVVNGSTDGTGSAARFYQPYGVAVDGAGTVYVADSNNNTIRWGATAVPALTSATTASGTTGQNFTYTLTFSGALPANYTASGLPSGLSLNPATGVISGIPSVVGTFPVTLGAVNGAGHSVNGTTLTLSIAQGTATVTLGSLSQAYDGTPKSATATTNPINLTVTFTYNGSPTPPTGVGSYPVVGTINDANYQGTASGTLVIGLGTPTITFGPLASHTYGDAPFSVSATASFGLTPTFSIVSGPATISDNMVTLTGAGMVTVRASLAATANTNAATPVDQSFTVDEPYTFTTLAGSASSSGTTDGTGSAARFSFPDGVAVDGSGNVYVADGANHTIRKITAGGVVTTLAGTAGRSGSTDGTGVVAQFYDPWGVAVDGSGNVYVADYANHTVRKITAGGVVTTLAGTAGSNGSTDGTGSTARFASPEGVAVDGSGNVYVADQSNNTIRQITSGGVVTTLAGSATNPSGSTDGTGSAALFNYPIGVAVDGSGSVYVADYGNNTIRQITSGGVVTTLAGSATNPSGSTDGTGSAALFNNPIGVAVDGSGNVYVAEYGNNTIRKITSGGVVTTLAGSAGNYGSTNGTGSAARFNTPYSVAVDATGTVYVADSRNNTIRWGSLAVPALTSATTASGTTGQSFTYTLTFSGALPANFTASGLPSGLSLNPATGVIAGTPTAAGNFTVTVGAVNGAGPSVNGTTLTLTITQGTATVTLGSLSQAYDGTPKSATETTNPLNLNVTFTYNGSPTPPTAVGSYAVVGTISNANYQGTASGTLVIGLGSPTITFGPLASHTYGDAPFSVSATASFGLTPTYSIVSGPATINGNMVTLTGAGTVTVRASLAATANTNAAYVDQSFTVTPAYTFTTLAGTAGVSGSTDGTGSAARFYNPAAVAVDGVGNVYVADASNATIRKITAGGVVTTLAGTAGSRGSADGSGGAARFDLPSGVAVDGAGNVYVADRFLATIRKITAGGVVTTLAGTAGSHGWTDGTGTAAQFYGPTGVAVDGAGNVYVADADNDTIRKITAGGVVTTLAGTANTYGSTDGTGTAARFYQPFGVAVDGAGNVYVADWYYSTIRKITAGGVVTTLAGSAGNLGSADGTGSAAQFNSPIGLAVDDAGNIYVADQGNNTIRKIVIATKVVTTLAGSTDGIPGSTDGTGSAARFFAPYGVAVDAAGTVYVADRGNNTIRWGAMAVPSLTSATTASGTTGQNFAYTLTFSGALPANCTASGLPSGLSLNPVTGVIAGTPTVAGTFPVTLGAVNGAGPSSATLTLTIAQGTAAVSFSAWQQANFTADELADPNKSGPNAVSSIDGLSNLMKYALGLAPKTPATSAQLPAPSSNSTNWAYTFTRPTYITDVTYSVEVSTDNLVTWSSSGVLLQLVTSADGTDTWQATYPVASAGKISFRLKVSRPSS